MALKTPYSLVTFIIKVLDSPYFSIMILKPLILWFKMTDL